MDPEKGLGSEDSGYKEISRRRASARVWRGRSADLEPPGDYQLSVGGEMRSGRVDLQNPSQKIAGKIRSEKVKI